MKEGIRYIEDILKEVSEEKKIPYKELKELWNLHIERIKYLMDKEGVHIIHLPKVASLFFNPLQNKFQNSKNSKNKYNKEKEQEVFKIVREHRERDIKTRYLYLQLKSNSLYSFYLSLRKFFGFRRKYTSKEKAIKALEKYSLGEITEKDFNGSKFRE